jgi:SOS-response transcriptional repressor LexA
MRNTNPAKLGRPRKEGEPLVGKELKLTPSMWDELAARRAETGIAVTEIVRRAVARELNPQPVKIATDAAMAGTDSFRAPYLTKAPCGPFREALDHASFYTLSKDVADTLEARDGDVIVQADGESMVGAGINDSDLLLMRPVPENRNPSRGEVALVQIFRADGLCEGTIKKWMGGTPPRLHDGDDEELPLPDDVERLVPVCVLRGVIARR